MTSPPMSRCVIAADKEPALGMTATCPPFQFMSDPVLYQEKLLKPAVVLLEKRATQKEDKALRVLSLHALSNMALGAPMKVKQYRKVLLEKCLVPLREPSVTAEAMDALTKILAEL
ncbi:Maestro heat-like repeat-containing protein member 2A [Saguinus oedipus]|uniref:Maestro heat-like repeat-containing protein member 2A n=1 Tax=Saguinus oedipus TaxID=9490 RepID=A0ABQ9VFW0_SAGOE|nr:Maestro heat-like repeat-containing protein member 2A [Saguinus oedipus]